MLRKSWVRGAVLLLLPVTTAEVALSTRQESFSWNEGDHIDSGYTNYTAAMRRVADMETFAQEHRKPRSHRGRLLSAPVTEVH